MPNSQEQQAIGSLIKQLRMQRGLTQQQFADMLSTSQSAVARIENGGQNLSTKELVKISTALDHPIVSVSGNQTDDLRIEGGHQLHGSIQVNTSKNGATGLFCASLLNKGKTILHGIPRIEEIFRMIEVFDSLGISVKWIDDHSVEIVPPGSWDLDKLNQESAKKMRSIIMLIGPLAHFVPQFTIPHAGGCKMGKRTISAHKHGLEPLGISIETDNDEYTITAKNIAGNETILYESSDTATENILMAAARIPEKTTIHFAQQNYMVQDVIGFLRALGVTITQTDVATLEVVGLQDINTTIEYHNSEDPIEAMAFISMGVTTHSELTITRCPIDFLRLELARLAEMGLKYNMSDQYVSHNGFTKLVDITVYPSELIAPPEKVHALPYPGINIDNLPFFVPIATQAEGSTLIHDWTWENRAIYFTELNRLNANVRLADPHRVFVEGPSKLRAAQIVCPPALRPSMIILITMLAAPGTSTLRNVYAIKRGYENIAGRLQSIGAKVSTVQELTQGQYSYAGYYR